MNENVFKMTVPVFKNSSLMGYKTVEYVINQKGCWLCTSQSPDAYGYCNFLLKGKKYKVHKIVLEHKLKRELLPFPTEITRHSCDVPQCINPEHLDVKAIVRLNRIERELDDCFDMIIEESL